MAEKRDCYEILGIPKTATDSEIKKAFRSMAKKYHPDANPNDKSAEEKFKEVNEAYSILSDPEKKANYDRFGYAGVDPNAGGGFSGFSGTDFGMGDIFGDIFGDMFGGGGGSRRRGSYSSARRGSDVGLRVTISFEEAAFGCKKDISYARTEQCTECGGTGAAKGSSPKTCPKCHGSGQVTYQQRTPFGMMQSTNVCDQCHGTGKVIDKPCRECHGNGTVRKTKKLEVSIPAGIDDGQRISLSGQGNAGENGGSFGDLVILVSVRKHSLFERDGNNIYFEMPITFAEAAMGAKITIPTLEGEGELTIPEGTQSGSVFSVRGKGIPYINSKGRGDLLVKVNIETPKGLTKKQKDLLKEFDNACSDKNHIKKKSFFDKFSRK